MARIKNCRTCGEPFEYTRASAGFCSSRCRQRNYRMQKQANLDILNGYPERFAWKPRRGAKKRHVAGIRKVATVVLQTASAGVAGRPRGKGTPHA